eukprot:Amastigsp_a5757_6.p1 type:complete len:112 gc:universal Amastigsp_a5757_6:500-165(-)
MLSGSMTLLMGRIQKDKISTDWKLSFLPKRGRCWNRAHPNSASGLIPKTHDWVWRTKWPNCRRNCRHLILQVLESGSRARCCDPFDPALVRASAFFALFLHRLRLISEPTD